MCVYIRTIFLNIFFVILYNYRLMLLHLLNIVIYLI